MEEIFKDVIGYEGLYKVSNLGNIKSLKFGKEKILKPRVDRVGYLLMGLWENGVCKMFKIHRLVAKAFIDNPNNKPQVNHINGLKSDNKIENLELVTASENMQHAYKAGLLFNPKGEKHSHSKLTNEQVLAIRNDIRTHQQIAKDCNVSNSLISDIKRGKRWNHI
jgi:hypothetical protein